MDNEQPHPQNLSSSTSSSAASTTSSASVKSYAAGKLVWVRVGKTDHHAHIVAATSATAENYTVRWCTTGEVEEVEASAISPGLSPRKRASRSDTMVDGSTDDASGGAIESRSAAKSSQAKKKKRSASTAGGKKGGSRLSLGRNRKKLAEARKMSARRTSTDEAADMEVDFPDSDKASNPDKVSGDTDITTVRQPAAVAVVVAPTANACATPKANTVRIVSPATILNSRPGTGKKVQGVAARSTKSDDSVDSYQKQLYNTPMTAALVQQQPDSGNKEGTPSSNSSVKNKEELGQSEQSPISNHDNDRLAFKYSANHFLENPISSAYVQHLAEMSHTILNDMRWRVPNETDSSRTKSVLAWENGDDLSAVAAFANVWDGKIGGQHDNLCPGFSTCESSKEAGSEENSAQKDFGRALNLYSRLFVRKGPWFTADDLYFRYYRHLFSVKHDESGSRDSNANNGTVVDVESDIEEEISDEGEESVSAPSANTHPTLDDHHSALVLIFTDIMRLHHMRLLRTFVSERECGIIAGNTTMDGTGLLLNAGGRSEVVNRLGGGKKIKSPKGGLSRSSSVGSRSCSGNVTEDSRRRGRSGGPSENLIWAQMTRQRSILASLSSATSSTPSSSILLPVRKHVHESLQRKFASRILGTLDKTSSVRIGDVISTMNNAWSEALEAFDVGDDNNDFKSSFTSFRLREAPATGLRRAARLYLCAVGGPGSMRGDAGTSGWASVKEQQVEPIKPSARDIPFEARRIIIAGGNSWHKVSHPGLSARLGISIFSFLSQYQYLPVTTTTIDPDEMKMIQIFTDTHSFKRWEACAELRATFDHLMEIHDIISYLCRRGKKRALEMEEDPRDSETSVLDSIPIADNLFLLNASGRKTLIDELITFNVHPRSALCAIVHDRVESTLDEVSNACGDEDSTFSNDAEHIICAICVIAMNVLQLRFTSMSEEDMQQLILRPWLRHLSWESVLAYLLWDCLPVLEKRKCYALAVNVLQTILNGNQGDFMGKCEGVTICDKSCPSLTMFVRCILSRRVRGKAFERLVVDRGHLERVAAKAKIADESNDEAKPKSTKQIKKKKKEAPNPQSDNEIKDDDCSAKLTAVQNLCLDAIDSEGRECSVPFSALRSLARRLKLPLAITLNGIDNAEMKILSIRTENDEADKSNGSSKDESTSKSSSRALSVTGYSEWRPKVDFSIANSITYEDKDGVGKRCAFVGWEEDDNNGGMARTRSMNVEELALEEYAAGRLPNQSNDRDSTFASTTESGVKGGWAGWHDEGGHVRALFRILCAPSVLEIDTSNDHSFERKSIFLAAYQGAPLDLHVGFQGSTSSYPRGFFQRRKDQIEHFLGELEQLSPQQISDRVYDSIMARVDACNGAGGAKMVIRDSSLHRDIGEVRTLSFLAAGLGGSTLAAIFRCLCFDYRHYSGGLPDLTLARAVCCSSSMSCGDTDQESAVEELVDLGEWIGEAFSAAEIAKGQVVELCRILADRDDEFLGCSKVGETGAGGSSQRWRQGRRQKQDVTAKRGEDIMASSESNRPPRLILSHNGRPVQAECMFVEVKSANDRLDSRQEDWLNVLDGVGNARVCKFNNNQKRTQSAKKTKKKRETGKQTTAATTAVITRKID